MGLRMAARLLDNGRYVVLWPMDAPLRTCGEHFVVDAYSQGALFLMDEVGCSPRLCALSWERGEQMVSCTPASVDQRGIAFELESLS